MATTLEELQQQLTQGAQARSQLTGLDERAVRANALRDREMPTVNQYGAASPFQQLDAAFGRYQGKRDMKAIDAERATAREQIAQTANALPLYKQQYEENKPITLGAGERLVTSSGEQIAGATTPTRFEVEKYKVDLKAVAESEKKTENIRGSGDQLDAAIAALKDGANTGFFADLLPNVRQSALAIQAAKDQLALYEISKYTFGSLSQAEGDWLKDVSIPTKMDEDDLLPYLERKREGLRRAESVEAFVQEMRSQGLQVTDEQKKQILYAGGFSFAD